MKAEKKRVGINIGKESKLSKRRTVYISPNNNKVSIHGGEVAIKKIKSGKERKNERKNKVRAAKVEASGEWKHQEGGSIRKVKASEEWKHQKSQSNRRVEATKGLKLTEEVKTTNGSSKKWKEEKSKR